MASSAQNRKPAVPGSPRGQQHDLVAVAAGRGTKGGAAGCRCGGKAGSGAVGGVGIVRSGPLIGMMSASFGTAGRRAGRGCREPPLRIGDGRLGRSSLCALPTTAFLETPSLRPISAVEWPSDQRARSSLIVTSVHVSPVDGQGIVVSLS